jgi:hypothetical protein
MSPFNPHKRNLYIVPEPRRSTRAGSQNIGARAPAPIPQYVRMPIVNDDLHVVGHDYVRVGAGLRNYIRHWVAEGGCR